MPVPGASVRSQVVELYCGVDGSGVAPDATGVVAVRASSWIVVVAPAVSGTVKALSIRSTAAVGRPWALYAKKFVAIA